MSTAVKIFGLSFFVSVLASCANKPLTPIDNLDRYKNRLLTISQWEVKGRINVRVPDDSDTASVTWENNNDNYQIRFRGPVGIGSARIIGSPQQVRLEQSGEEPVIASSAEELLYTQLGREIPISDLHYWVRGLPAPQPNPTELNVNENGSLQFLNQSGWHLTFEDYRAVGEWNMPKKIIAKRDDFVLTLYGLRWDMATTAL